MMKRITLAASVFILCGAPAFAQILTQESADAPPPQPAGQANIPDLTAREPAASAPSASSKEPLEITADKSLEWRRNEKKLSANGNALARQGDVSVAADTLTASYAEGKTGGGMKISQVSAENNVVIKSKDSEAYGQKADYDLDKGYATMTGDNLKLVTKDQTVTAKDKFEYWVKDAKLSAVGGAKVLRGQDTLEADAISAIMKDDEKGQRKVDSVEAMGHVVIKTPTETVTGDRGLYHASTNKAELLGNIKIHRGPNILEGDRAEVDMTTNVSQIFGNPAQGSRVKGVFYPGSEKKTP